MDIVDIVVVTHLLSSDRVKQVMPSCTGKNLPADTRCFAYRCSNVSNSDGSCFRDATRPVSSKSMPVCDSKCK